MTRPGGEVIMPDEIGGACPLAHFQSDPSAFLHRLRETGRPVFLTIDGKAEMVVQDPASYRRLVEMAERAERLDALQSSIADLRAGRVTPVEEMLAEMRAILAGVPGR